MVSILTALGVLIGTSTMVHAADVVGIPDDDLRVCINDELGQTAESDITESQLGGLTFLDCDWYHIRDLTGLEYATSLEYLRISWALDVGLSPRGIEPLAGLTNLVELDLELTNLRDIAPLANLTNLERLYLGDNLLDDDQLVHLSGLHNLQELSISGNYDITDVSPLAGLTELRALYAQFTPITSVEPLAGLTHLEVLYLNYGTAITDISPLAGLIHLTELALDDQMVRLSDATVGVGQENPVRGPDGSAVPSDSEFYHADDNAFTFTSLGTGIETDWETTVTIGNATTTFSGTIIRDVVEPAALPDPEVTVSPDDVTQSELADAGVQIVGTGFPAETSVTLSVNGVEVASETAGSDGEVIFDYTSTSLGVGTHAIVLEAGDLLAEASLRVTADPTPDYDPAVIVTPASVTEDALAETGVTITGTGFPEGVQVTFDIAGVEVHVATADANGEVSFLYRSSSLGAGDHRVLLTAADYAVDGLLTVTASIEPTPTPTTPDDQDGSRDDQDSTSDEEAPVRDDQRSTDDSGLAATGGSDPRVLLTVSLLLVAIGVAISLMRNRSGDSALRS